MASRDPVESTGVRGIAATAAVVVLVAAASALGFAFDAQLSAAAQGLVYVLAVMAAAAWLPRWAGVLASLLAVSALNFFFVPPRRTFAVDGVEYWFTLAVLLAVSLLLNALVGSLRRRRREAERREADAVQAGDLSTALAVEQSPAELVDAFAQWWRAHVAPDCALHVDLGDGRGLQRFAGFPPGEDEAGAARWAIEHRRPLGRGCVDWPALPLWCAPLQAAAPMGALLLPWPHAPAPDTATQRHWQALAVLLGQRLERARVAREAAHARAQADAERQRNAMLASLSHDLRTPLTALLGNASLLREHDAQLPAARRAELLEHLEQEARDLVAMAENVLQSARFSQPGWRLRTQWESPEEVLGATLARLRRRWPGAAIEAQAEPGLPPVEIEAGLLSQVLANLVDNALRHGGGDVRVRIDMARRDDTLRIAVRDDGKGLPPGDPERLFDMARDGDASRDGSGLGLSLCRTLVAAHGGRIEARAAAPGAEFVVTLPLAHAPGMPG